MAGGSVAAAMGKWVMCRRSSPPGGLGKRNQTKTPLGPPFAASFTNEPRQVAASFSLPLGKKRKKGRKYSTSRVLKTLLAETEGRSRTAGDDPDPDFAEVASLASESGTKASTG